MIHSFSTIEKHEEYQLVDNCVVSRKESVCNSIYDSSGYLFNRENSKRSCYKRSTEFLIKYIRTFKETGVSGILIAEPAAGLLSEDMCDEFSSKYIRQNANQLHLLSFYKIRKSTGIL